MAGQNTTCINCDTHCRNCGPKKTWKKTQVPFGVLYDVIKRHHLGADDVGHIFELNVELSYDHLLKMVNECVDDTDRFMLGQFLK